MPQKDDVAAVTVSEPKAAVPGDDNKNETEKTAPVSKGDGGVQPLPPKAPVSSLLYFLQSTTSHMQVWPITMLYMQSVRCLNYSHELEPSLKDRTAW